MIGSAILPGPGTVVGAAVGGLGTLFGTFFLGEYQNSYDEAAKVLMSQGLSAPEIEKKASKHALVSSTAEFGTEFLSDVASAGIYGIFFKKAAKQPLKQTIHELVGTNWKEL